MDLLYINVWNKLIAQDNGESVIPQKLIKRIHTEPGKLEWNHVICLLLCQLAIGMYGN